MVSNWTLIIAIVLAMFLNVSSQRRRFGQQTATVEKGSILRIRQKPCWNSNGDEGRCMFVWDCVRINGTHLTTCVDGILFGTCCKKEQKEGSVTIEHSGQAEKRSPPATPPPLNLQNDQHDHNTTVTFFDKQNVIKSSSNLVSMALTRAPSKIFKNCGLPSMIPQMRVVGGSDSKMGEWPWQVSVRRNVFSGTSSTHRCGGVVLNENFVLTAGHCVADLLLQQIRVRFGDYDMSSVNEAYPHIERSAEQRFLHPKYTPGTYQQDLALIKVDKSIYRAPNILPICLPDSEDDSQIFGKQATITGWGRLNDGGRLATVLQKVRLPVINNTECESMFRTSGKNETIPDVFICAGYKSGDKDSCQGDSGGPLQLQADDGRWFLAGIISWGIGCAQPNLPGVCTRVSKFTNWILETVSANDS